MTALAIIAKEPVPGRVKTRLTPPCTPEQAARLAEAAMRDTVEAAVASAATRVVLVLQGRAPAWLAPGIEVVPQRGEGLAELLAAAFADIGERAFLVGMDTPQITPGLLDAGMAALEHADAAFGPAADGGYWGIGLRRSDREAFRDVPMSESHTGAAQLRRLAALGLRTARLPRLRDVDTFVDAHEVAAAAPRSRFAAALEALA